MACTTSSTTRRASCTSSLGQPEHPLPTAPTAAGASSTSGTAVASCSSTRRCTRRASIRSSCSSAAYRSGCSACIHRAPRPPAWRSETSAISPVSRVAGPPRRPVAARVRSTARPGTVGATPLVHGRYRARSASSRLRWRPATSPAQRRRAGTPSFRQRQAGRRPELRLDKRSGRCDNPTHGHRGAKATGVDNAP